jgi:hypothetical protein
VGSAPPGDAPMTTRFRTPKLRPGLGFTQALEQMRAGKTLHLEYFQGRPVWELGGLSVSPEVVALLISCAAIEPAHDSLFADAPSQTWRMKVTQAPALPTERPGSLD